MTTTIAENSNNDLFRDGSGNISFLSARNAVSQLCAGRVESQRGEMMYAKNQGMPTRATAWDNVNPKQFEASARDIIKATPDVTSVNSFSMSFNQNTLNYTAQISTIYGPVTVSTQ